MMQNYLKKGSLIPFTILPLLQSRFKCTLSTPVMLIDSSLFYDPGIS